MTLLRNCDWHKRQNIAKPGFKEVAGEVMCEDCFKGKTSGTTSTSTPVVKAKDGGPDMHRCACKPDCPKFVTKDKAFAVGHWSKKRKKPTPTAAPNPLGEHLARKAKTTNLRLRDNGPAKDIVEIRVPVEVLDGMWAKLEPGEKGIALGKFFEHQAL